MIPYSDTAGLNDRSSYYGGYKYPYILAYDDISYGLSDRNGQIQRMTFGFTFSDADRSFRTQLDTTFPYPTNRPLIIRQIDDRLRRLEGTPRIAANGFVIDYDTPSFQGQLKGGDWLTRRYSRSQNSQLDWQPLIRSEDFDINSTPPSMLKKPAPFAYGVYDDSDEQTVADTDFSTGYLPDPVSIVATVHGAPANPITRRYFISGMNSFFGNLDIRAWDDHRGETLGVMVDVPGCPDDAEFQSQLNTGIANTWVEITCSCPNAAGVRVYGRTGVQADGQLSGETGGLLLATDLGGGNFSFLDGKSDITGDAVLARLVTSEPPFRSNAYIPGSLGGGFVTTDTGGGEVKLGYTGLRWLSLGGFAAHEFIVSACAVKGNFKLYINDIRLSSAEIAANWFVPGTAEWTANVDATRNYFEIYGRRYTTIYARPSAAINLGLVSPDSLSAGGSRLTVNFDGIETVGDTTGTVITSIALQLQHFLENCAYPNLPVNSVAWASTPPFFTAVPSVTYVDHDSFTANDPGLTGGMIIGYGQEAVTVEEVIARFLLSIDCELSFNRKGQAMLCREPDAVPSSVDYTFDDIISIAENSLKISNNVRDFHNVLPYHWGPDYTGRQSGGQIFSDRGLALNLPSNEGWLSVAAGEVDVRDTTSIFNYDQTVAGRIYNMYCLRTSAQALTVTTRRLRRYSNNMRTAVFEVPMKGTNIKPGDTFAITAADGIGASGYVGKKFRAIQYKQRCGSNTIVLDAYDLERAINGAAVIVPVTPTSYVVSSTNSSDYLIDSVGGNLITAS